MALEGLQVQRALEEQNMALEELQRVYRAIEGSRGAIEGWRL